MGNIQSHATSNPNTIAQYASVEALNGSQETIEVMRQAFDARRIEMVNRIKAIPLLDCVVPEGAFYVMVDISKCFGKIYDGKVISSSLDFAGALLEGEKVAVIPGIAFDADQYVRLSYATSMDNVINGIDRIRAFCEQL
jgi:aspartate aminotransferase